MSKDITTAGPSRRQIAKGAAWAVPAVTVAAAAPALAASPLPVCGPGALVVSVENCDGLTLLGQPPRFRITNPSESGCTLPSGTPVELSGSGVAGVNLLGEQLANVGVLYSEQGTAALTNALAPGDSVVVNVFPSGLNVTVIGSATLSVAGSSGTFNLTAGVGSLVSICGVA